MTEIYLVRHPESTLNTHPSFISGRSNQIPVTERGAEQARRFAHVFSTQYPHPTSYYSSPAVRTKTLLDIYNQTTAQHNDYSIDFNLQEISQGQSEGKIRSEVYTPEVLELIAQQQFDFALPGGESLNDTSNRILTWTHEMEAKHPNGVILASTHGQAIRATVGKLLGWNYFECTLDVAHQIDNVSLTRLTVENGEITVDFLGKKYH